MKKFVELIQRQTDILLKNVEDQINGADLEVMLEKPEVCPHTKLELILGQYRHIMFHLGLSECLTVQSKGVWLPYTGFKYIKSRS